MGTVVSTEHEPVVLWSRVIVIDIGKPKTCNLELCLLLTSTVTLSVFKHRLKPLLFSPYFWSVEEMKPVHPCLDLPLFLFCTGFLTNHTLLHSSLLKYTSMSQI